MEQTLKPLTVVSESRYLSHSASRKYLIHKQTSEDELVSSLSYGATLNSNVH